MAPSSFSPLPFHLGVWRDRNRRLSLIKNDEKGLEELGSHAAPTVPTL